MERYVSGFLRSSLIWLLIGTAIGASMAIDPRFVRYRPAHLHALLLGFVMMMISGVAYHVIPRFTMAALHSPRLARIHLVIANLGLLLMVSGFGGRVHGVPGSAAMLAIGGSVSLLGAWAFAWNIWRTLDRAVQIPARAPGGRPVPTMPAR